MRGKLAAQFNPLMGKELRDRDYYWVMSQVEYATDVLFKSVRALQSLYRRMVEHARACVSAEDVLRFLGRKPHGHFQGEVQTPVVGAAAAELELGDRVYFRHAKAGELCERFASLYLLEEGRIVDEVPTYRGEGKTFL